VVSGFSMLSFLCFEAPLFEGEYNPSCISHFAQGSFAFQEQDPEAVSFQNYPHIIAGVRSSVCVPLPSAIPEASACRDSSLISSMIHSHMLDAAYRSSLADSHRRGSSLFEP
jgi:hypothetical protein